MFTFYQLLAGLDHPCTPLQGCVCLWQRLRTFDATMHPRAVGCGSLQIWQSTLGCRHRAWICCRSRGKSRCVSDCDRLLQEYAWIGGETFGRNKRRVGWSRCGSNALRSKLLRCGGVQLWSASFAGARGLFCWIPPAFASRWPFGFHSLGSNSSHWSYGLGAWSSSAAWKSQCAFARSSSFLPLCRCNWYHQHIANCRFWGRGMQAGAYDLGSHQRRRGLSDLPRWDGSHRGIVGWTDSGSAEGHRSAHHQWYWSQEDRSWWYWKDMQISDAMCFDHGPKALATM